MKLSFSIPAYNEEVNIGKCLGSIIRETKNNNYDVEIVVVDNASTDKTAEAAKKFPGVKVVSESRKGIVFARAAGFKNTTGDLIANIDADTMLTPGWIDTVFREFSKDPLLACLSGPFIYYDLSRSMRFWVKAFYGIGFTLYLANRFVLKVGSMVQGGNFVCRREAIMKAGGFDTSIDFYGEDTDIAKRLSRVGNVKWTFSLPMYASGRRLKEEGLIKTGGRYAINFFWVTFFKKPFTKKSTDVRIKK